MDYKESLALLEELGWKKEGYWNSRLQFSLTIEGKRSLYWLFEHFGIGIITPGDKYVYCEMTEAEIREFTEILTERLTIEAHPDDRRLSELTKCRGRMSAFMRRMRNRKDDEE